MSAQTPKETLRIGVVGLGYVGLPLAVTASQKGLPVVGYDIDREKINQLKHKEEQVLSVEERRAFDKSSITFEAEANEIKHCNVYIICVPTPVHEEDRTPDVTALVGASQSVGKILKPEDLVIVESTIQPSMSEKIVIPILEHESGLKAEQDFYYAHCPERINPGDQKHTAKSIPRVIGGIGPKSLARALEVYGTILDAQLLPMQNIKEAEAVKMVENAFRDLNIAFVNELALAFEKEGIDVVNVINGAATKPFGFMAHYPGCGVGGHCIPVDPHYLINYGLQHGFRHNLLLTARQVNDYMPYHIIALLQQALKATKRQAPKVRVTVLGLAYKKNINDTRESPAIKILNELRYEGIDTVAYDPFVPQLSTVDSLAEALRNTDAVIIATDHDAFRQLSPDDFQAHSVPIVIDGRNCLPINDFNRAPFYFKSVGRVTYNKN